MALCKYEEHLMSLVPTYKPPTEAELREFLFSVGATEDTLAAHLQVYDKMAQEIIDRGGVRIIGVLFVSVTSHLNRAVAFPASPKLRFVPMFGHIPGHTSAR